MDNIYNFIKINNKDNDTISIFITELDNYVKNKELLYLGNKFYKYLIENEFIKKDTIVILSFIKHFSKSIKNMVISKNDNIDLQLDSSKIIADYILNCKSKSIYNNYLIIDNKDELIIHNIKKKCSLKKHLCYFL